jgi:AraC-like DNA-binding protein
MYFHHQPPAEHLLDLVREFWIVENDGTHQEIQKIIPDGFEEIIVHYGDAYEINLHGTWERQDKVLAAGQIREYFHLRNTGWSAMLGIKLLPGALHRMFGWDMKKFANKVVALNSFAPGFSNGLTSCVTKENAQESIKKIESYLTTLNIQPPTIAHPVVQDIVEKQGNCSVEELASAHSMSRRTLERKFNLEIGISPKLLCRIFRFNHIFQIMQTGDHSWISVAVQSGFFDQAHFIRNFKEFTGEDPTAYGFDEKNLANFFLNR